MKTPEHVAEHRRAAHIKRRPFRIKIKPNTLTKFELYSIPVEIAILLVDRTVWALIDTNGSVMVFPQFNKSEWGQRPWYIPDGTFKRIK